jgi:integrase
MRRRRSPRFFPVSMMVYSFARIGAVIQMKVGDYFVQGRRRWVRLHEKGGKEHDVPCHHRLDQCLHDYIEAAGITDDIDGYLFRTARRKIGQLTTNPLFQQDAHRIIRRRAKSGRHRNADWQSHVPRDRHHGVSEEQRKTRSRAANRQP